MSGPSTQRANYPADVLETAQIAAVLERCQDPRGKNLRSCQLFGHRRRGPDQGGRHGRANRIGCEGWQAGRHRRQAGRPRQLRKARRARRPAISSSRRSPSKQSRATGSTRVCSIWPPTRSKASNSSRRRDPAIRFAAFPNPRRRPPHPRRPPHTPHPRHLQHLQRPRPPAAKALPPILRPLRLAPALRRRLPHRLPPLRRPRRHRPNSSWRGAERQTGPRFATPWRPRPPHSAALPTMMSRRPATSISASPRSSRHLSDGSVITLHRRRGRRQALDSGRGAKRCRP